MPSADEIISELNLLPHPEGGYYRQTFRGQNGAARAFSTAIYYLLKAGEISRWHRIDAAEVWHWYGGAALELKQWHDTNSSDLENLERPSTQLLGNDVMQGARPQIVVPAGVWQSAVSTGDWTLAGCSVAPGFEFEKFELAPEGWEPEGNA